MAGGAPTAKPAPFLRPLDLLDRGILLAESALCLVVVAMMVLVAVVEAAFGRFITNEQIRAAMGEAPMHATLWAAFLGASFATRGRRHLAIDVLGRLLPDRARRVTVGIAAALGAVVAFALSRGLYETLQAQATSVAEQIRQNVESGIASASVDRSYQFHFIIPAGFLLIGARLLLHSFHEFMAALRGSAVGPRPPVEPAPDREKPAHGTTPANEALPADASSVDHEARYAPVSQAGWLEVAIAIVALVVLIVATMGTTVFTPALVLSFVAALSLVIPLLLRYRERKSLVPTVASDGEASPPANVKEIVVGLLGVGAVIAFAKFGIDHIHAIPMAWGIAFFVGMALLGAPLFTFIGGLALFIWSHGTSVVDPMPIKDAVEDVLGLHFARMSVLPTIPIFTLAGYLMSESKTPQRLVRLARAFLGFAPGGLAIVCVLASAFFTVFSGASGITIVAIGGLLLPALLKEGYKEKFSLGLVTTGGALGITFYPCLPFIVYGIVAGLQEVPPGHERLQLDKFLFAGFGPGMLLIGMLVIYSLVMGVVQKIPRSKFDAKEAMGAFVGALPELLLPIFLISGLKFGIFSPIQGAAFTAFYVFVIEVFLYKDLSITRDIPRIIPESMVLVGAIFVKLCAATVLTGFFVQDQTADRVFEALTCGEPAQQYMAAHADTIGQCREAVTALMQQGQTGGGIINSDIAFLIALNVFLLVVGMLVDIFSAIVLIVPLISGIAIAFNINPYHLGVVFLMNLEIGYLMPPMGLNLFIAGFRFNRPVPDLYRVVLPFIGIFVAALLITTYVPSITLFSVPPSENAAVIQPTTGPTTPDANPAPTQPAGNCDEPGEDESFEDFDRRCNVSGGGAPAGAAPAAPAADCEQPGPDESFEDFDRRCSVSGAPAEAPPAPATPADAPAATSDAGLHGLGDPNAVLNEAAGIS